jgi:uncharacterized protein (TIGR00369 family)
MSTVTAREYGIASPQDIAGMTGKEILQAMADGRLPAPPICETLNFWLAEVGDGFAAFEGDTSERLLNPMGIVHGGWALTLIDSAAGCAGQTLLPAGSRYATVETKANFSRTIQKDTGHVRAEARAVSQGRQIISVEARVLGSGGQVLAHGTSTLLVSQGPQ